MPPEPIPIDADAIASAATRPKSTLPSDNGNDDGDGATSEVSQPTPTGTPTLGTDTDPATDPAPYFTMEALSDETALTFDQPFLVTNETFQTPVTIKWTGTRLTNFEQRDVKVAWIANVDGKASTIAAPSDFTLGSLPPGSGISFRSVITVALDLRDGLNSHDGLDMFLVLKYPDMDAIDSGRPIVQVSPLFTVTSSREKQIFLKSSFADRQTDPDLKNGFTTREGEKSELPRGSVCDPTAPTKTSCKVPASPSSTNPTIGDDASTGRLSASESGARGLSTGAKVGIGVGVGIAALLILALIAFFLFRRRQRRRASDHVHSASAFDASPRGGVVTDFMADKEMSGPRLADSPYSEDGRGSALLALHSNEFQIESSPRSFAPYSDVGPAGAGAAPHAITSDVRIESRTDAARSSTPDHAVPSSVAHLVEDGMTEDQIRRLEEEERVLDRAIEQAGHSNQ